MPKKGIDFLLLTLPLLGRFKKPDVLPKGADCHGCEAPVAMTHHKQTEGNWAAESSIIR